jgi:polysaccharide export outer membrane protein
MSLSVTNTKKILWLISFFLFFCLTAFEVTAASEYIVDEGDVLKINVYGHDDLSTTVRVSGDGTIMFPLLNQVAVANLTIPQISAKLSDALADGYIIDPQVNVFVEDFRSQNVFVSGEVNKPGAYQFEMDMSLIKVISLAGGFKETAAKELVTITRKVKDKIVEINKAPMDEVIEPGDVIVIPEGLLQEIFVTGQVKKPGICQYEPGISVIKAITLAGGFTDIANKAKITITRKVANEDVELRNVKMNEVLQPGDVLIVPESFF